MTEWRLNADKVVFLQNLIWSAGDTMRLFQIPFLHGSRKLNMHIERILQIRTSVYQEISAKPVKYIFKGGDEIYIF